MVLTSNRMMCTGVHLLVLVFCAVGAGRRLPLPFDYGFIENELKLNIADYVEFKKIADSPIAYRAWGVWNFKYPASDVVDVALDFGHYSTIFSHVHRCERIVEPINRIRPLGTWFVEGRAALARVWSIGNIDTIKRTDSTHFRFFASQNEDPVLEAKWAKQERGWLNFRTNGIHFAAFVVAIGRDSCRMGVIAQGLVREKMPEWLVRLAARIIFPHLMNDLDAEVKRRIEDRKPKQDTWYGKISRAFHRFF